MSEYNKNLKRVKWVWSELNEVEVNEIEVSYIGRSENST